MNKKNIIIVSVLSIALGAGFWTVFQQRNKKENSLKTTQTIVKPKLTVQVENPIQKTLKETINVSGNVIAWQESSIGSELSGLRIQNIFVDVGSVVKKDTLLAQLNDDSIQAEILQAKAALLEAKANLKQAQENAQKARNLENSNALSEQQKTQFLTTEQVNLAKLESAKANLKLLEIKLSKTQIKSPVNGIVSIKNASLGSLSSTSEMFKIISEEKLQWQPQIASDYLLQINKNMPIKIRLQQKTLDLKINEISPYVNSQTRQGTLLINISKEEHKNRIKPGMFLSGLLEFKESPQLLINSKAVVLKDAFNYVFVVKSDNRVEQRKVVLGDVYGNSTAIKSGLKIDEKVVVTGATFLNDGDLISIQDVLENNK